MEKEDEESRNLKNKNLAGRKTRKEDTIVQVTLDILLIAIMQNKHNLYFIIWHEKISYVKNRLPKNIPKEDALRLLRKNNQEKRKNMSMNENLMASQYQMISRYFYQAESWETTN